MSNNSTPKKPQKARPQRVKSRSKQQARDAARREARKGGSAKARNALKNRARAAQVEVANSHERKSNSAPAQAASKKPKKSGDERTRGETRSSYVTAAQSLSTNNQAHFVEVGSEHDGQRVDNFLVTYLKGVPKTHIYRIIRKGEVRVNKGRVKQTTRLKDGDSIRIPPIKLAQKSEQHIDGARYEFLNKMVLYEDDSLLIINKPSGMAVHAGSGIKVGVIEALRALRTDIKYLELVHRLDRETSGCLVLAKRSSALKVLHEDFKTNSLKNKRLDKRYLALVKGQWKHGQRRITKALNTDARRRGERHVMVDENGRYASSIVVPVHSSATASLIEVKLLTGRTHQVRVHTQSEGHPIAGDTRYGDTEFNRKLKEQGLSRLFLHASRLSFTHPISNELVTVKAPLPEELDRIAQTLKLCSN